MVMASVTRNELISFTVAHGNMSRLYTLCTRWQDGLTGQKPLLNGKFFALEGELIQDHGHIVNIDVGVFSIPIIAALVPTAEVISEVLPRYPALDTMAVPYTAGDPDTEGVKTMKIWFVPHPLVGLWILNEDRITWENSLGQSTPQS